MIISKEEVSELLLYNDSKLIEGCLENGGRDLDFLEGSVEHDEPLLKKELYPISELPLGSHVVELIFLKILSQAPLNGQHVLLHFIASMIRFLKVEVWLLCDP